MDMSSPQFLKTALSCAENSSKIFIKYFGHAGKVFNKENDPRNLVTEIDPKIERQIRKQISQKFPGHSIVGEEIAGIKTANSGFTWYIDPIDGTSNYIKGFPFCCISIALWDKKGPLACVVHNPILNLTYKSQRGLGAFCNNKKITVSQQNKLQEAYGGYGWGRDVNKAAQDFPKLIKNLNKIRTLGSTAMEISLVASGVYDFHIQAGMKIWDFAAAAGILLEAGGKITDWQGLKLSSESKSLIASNGKLQNQILNLTESII